MVFISVTRYALKQGAQLVLLVLLSFVLTACQNFSDSKIYGDLTPSHTPYTVEKVSQDDAMVKLGATQHPHILKTYGGEYHDIKLERMVAKIVGKLTAVSDKPDQTFRVTILDSPNVNAFALPGGYVYVTRGMLALANDSSEVAAVLAHEMAHVTANHGVKRQQKEAEVELANQVVTEIIADQSVERETAIRGKLRLAQFSRNQELQADSLGIATLAKAGYDPFASPRFLRSMEAYAAFRTTSGASDANLDFLASHPATPQRIQLANAMARKVGAPGVGERDREDVLRGIDGMIFGDTADEGYIRGNQFIHPNLGISFEVPQDYMIDNSSDAVMVSGPNDIAIRFDGVDLPANMSASRYMQSGWINGLDESSIVPMKINGLDAARARAENDRWQFDVVVIIVKKQIFRFLTAAPKNSAKLEDISLATISSFKALSKQEIAALKPLRVHVVTVTAGQTVPYFASLMQGTREQEKLFRIINALSPNDSLSLGDKVKIIAE